MRRRKKSSNPSVSKIENEFGKALKEAAIQFETQHQIDYKFFDFKIKNKNVLIEFHGDYWHCNPEIYKEGVINKIQARNKKNDNFKKGLAIRNGYFLFEVWENDFKKNKSKVISEIKKIIENF